MSEEQLKAFLEAVKADAGLQEKLKGAGDLDAAVAIIAKEAGFDVSKADWLKYQAIKELSDEELEGVAGGGWRKQESKNTWLSGQCNGCQ